MSTAVLAEGTAEPSPLFKARMAAVFGLMTALTGTFAPLVGGRLSIAASLTAAACYVAATLPFYGRLKPVNGNPSSLAAFCSLLGCAIGAPGNLFLRAANIPTFFFGLHCFLAGYLILRPTVLPRIVGALMVFAGLGWLTQGSLRLLAAPLGRSPSSYLAAPGIIGEIALTSRTARLCSIAR